MNVLITTYALKQYAGAELYVRDLALELKRQGHMTAVYTSAIGPVAKDLRAQGVPVVSRLRSVPFAPDLIHGSFRRDIMAALLHFPNVPGVYVCHTHSGWMGGAPNHPRIRQYLGVSQLCVDRMLADGIPSDRVGLTRNWVDLQRFQPREALPERPRRALLFSNYAHASTHLPAVREACRRADLELDIVGAGVGNAVLHPEDILGRYDLVFAKAKAAMEAMAVGAAVILCDFGGVGPMVTSAEFDILRPMNFGFQALRDPHTPEALLAQIDRYDAADAACVSERFRRVASLEDAVRELVEIYQNIIQKARASSDTEDERKYAQAFRRDTLLEQVLIAWQNIPLGQRDRLTNLPGMSTLRSRLTQRFFRPQHPAKGVRQ
ncbi:hypothetical protein CCAX7_46780 [Capsulimonas corticalis]|uniref:Uncharacterized protein n=1 Tax=Capsulimonas corticalis TaxID=2219043 RepID=A0A402CQC4_9BACT|nr:glycosyltransferase family 4 protein [Capsulimonas corticalis]BDI32627.1 hypothetical protein CCAX7_46780 [Capsulimonas corticalis]